MKISELLVAHDSQITEAPLGKIGSALGKGINKLSTAVGAATGGIAGIPGAFKQGFQQGKQAVSGQPTTSTAPTKPNPNSMKALFQKGREQAQQRIAAKTAANDTEQPSTVVKKYDALGAVDNPNRPNLVGSDDKYIQDLKQKLAAAQAEITKLRMQANKQVDTDDNPNLVRSDSSIEHTGKSITESLKLFRHS